MPRKNHHQSQLMLAPFSQGRFSEGYRRSALASPLALPQGVPLSAPPSEPMPLPLRRRHRPKRARADKKAAEQRPAIADMAPEDRPRERLLRSGAAALSDAELLAVLLRSGRPGRSVLAMADDFLAACGGLRGLMSCDLDIAKGQKLGNAQSASLLAAVEIGRRLSRHAVPSELLEDPAVVARYLYLRYSRIDQEVMGALFLDVHNRRVGETECFRGTLMRMIVEPRPILREAMRRNAHGILLFHHHPSGDPTPSEEDFAFTLRMCESCDAVGFELLDHLVVGGDRWVSLRRLRPW